MNSAFRFPFAIMYYYRKRGMAYAITQAVACAVRPVTRDDAASWINYVVRSKLYQKTDADA